MNKIYKGIRLNNQTSKNEKFSCCLITVNGEILPSVKEYNNGSMFTGFSFPFEYGKRSPRSKNLAESILTDYIQDELGLEGSIPVELVELFYHEVILPLNPDAPFEIPSFQIEDFLNSVLERE